MVSFDYYIDEAEAERSFINMDSKFEGLMPYSGVSTLCNKKDFRIMFKYVSTAGYVCSIPILGGEVLEEGTERPRIFLYIFDIDSSPNTSKNKGVIQYRTDVIDRKKRKIESNVHWNIHRCFLKWRGNMEDYTAYEGSFIASFSYNEGWGKYSIKLRHYTYMTDDGVRNYFTCQIALVDNHKQIEAKKLDWGESILNNEELKKQNGYKD